VAFWVGCSLVRSEVDDRSTITHGVGASDWSPGKLGAESEMCFGEQNISILARRHGRAYICSEAREAATQRRWVLYVQALSRKCRDLRDSFTRPDSPLPLHLPHYWSSTKYVAIILRNALSDTHRSGSCGRLRSRGSLGVILYCFDKARPR
jgi:hypothetical protein